MQCKARGCTEKSKCSEEIYCEMTAADCTSLVTSPFFLKKKIQVLYSWPLCDS